MITDAIIVFFTDIFDMILGTLPVVPVPDWLNDASSMAGTVYQFAVSMGVWFPSGLAFTVIGALVATWVIAYGIHGLRMAVSLFTGGGGKA